MKNWQTRIVRGALHGAFLYERIASLSNIFTAWREFRRGKQLRHDVLLFELRLEDNLLNLHYNLQQKTYKHGPYESFYVNDPKRRHIHKASVRDRLLHHALVRVIEPLFERTFIFDSWSCRKNKGIHRAVVRFQKTAFSLSRNNTIPVWVLKLDIMKFFASVDHSVLLAIINRHITCSYTRTLIEDIVESFSPGIPLGNLTSQLFANVYLNVLDHHIKHVLKIPHHMRYCDDFVILGTDKEVLENVVPILQTFLWSRLRLRLHPDKIVLKRFSQGVDFLGFICFPHHRVLRSTSRRRMVRNVNETNVSSYLGLISHTRSRDLRKNIIQKSYQRTRTHVTGNS